VTAPSDRHFYLSMVMATIKARIGRGGGSIMASDLMKSEILDEFYLVR
jgi:hypothetical protein